MKTLIAVTAITVALSGCATNPDDPNRRTKTGAVTGAAAGAVAGAVVGNQSGNRDRGAAVGAVVGAAAGAVIGRRMDQQERELRQIEGVEVERTADDRLNVSLKNEVLFDVDSSTLRGVARTTLSDVAQVFARYPDQTISIEGHADSTGAASYNQRLSERRAESVRSYLVNAGVPSANLRALGFGETRPRASNDTAEGRQLNRRVEIHVQAIEEPR
jgi:outer membrane protein OmpA-like peptidoglycan-associated protein